LILAIDAAKNFKLRQFDVSTAFLSGDIDKTIYMEQPEGYVDKEHHEYVCKLRRAIYGLKQAPIQFNKKMCGTLKNIGLMPIHSDRCVFIGQVGDNTVYMALYVDDAILASSSIRAIDSVIESLSKVFELKVGEASTFVGIEIKRNKETGAIRLSQAGYVRKLLKMFDMSNTKPVSTPMAVNVQVPKLEVQPEVKFPYREEVGSLLYAAMVTRPDIANAVSQLSQHLCAFGEEHIAAVKRVMRYLRRTIDVALEYRSDDKLNLFGYVDADHAGDQATRRSMTGYIFMFNGRAVTWASKRQGIVALSTCEAEYILR